MKKKLSLILCLVFTVLTMAGCGADPTSVDYFGRSYNELQSAMETEVASLIALSDEDKTYIQSYGTDTAIRLVETWEEAVAGEGAYQGLGSFSVSRSQDTMTVEQQAVFQNRTVVIAYVYTYNYETEMPELTEASADKVYSMGEKMAKAGMNTLMGLGTVFTVLVLISLIIYCFRFISYFQKKKARGSSPDDVKAAEEKQPLPAWQNVQSADESEIVAAIAAAIAAANADANAFAAGASTDSFVVRSIRRRTPR